MSSLAFVLGIAREIGVGVFIKRLARSMGGSAEGSSVRVIISRDVCWRRKKAVNHPIERYFP